MDLYNLHSIFRKLLMKCYLNDLIVSSVAYVCTPEVLEEQNSFCAPNPSKASISCKLSKVLAQTWIFFLSCIFVNFDTKRGMPDSEEVAAPYCSSSRMIWHHICSGKLGHQIRQELKNWQRGHQKRDTSNYRLKLIVNINKDQTKISMSIAKNTYLL